MSTRAIISVLTGLIATILLFWAVVTDRVKCSSRWCETYMDFLLGVACALLMAAVLMIVTHV